MLLPFVKQAYSPSSSMHTGDRTTATKPNSGQQQLTTTTPIISVEERQLLDAIVSTAPLRSLSHIVSRTGRGNVSRNKSQKQQQSTANMVPAQAGNTLMTQGVSQHMPNPILVGRDIYMKKGRKMIS
uniref:Uncharacterized protein LOC104224991 n=1 Tax=Nicotiana sylvestris TaxID=4096 RepID=A0A1U7W8T3_NICSY|nr:PREDICTED: uncharacterized protein LOC104224991 [Nicotiana sylvestris]